MYQVQDLQKQLEAEQDALNKARKNMQSVKALKRKLNKAFEMFETIKEELESVDVESQIKAL